MSTRVWAVFCASMTNSQRLENRSLVTGRIAREALETPSPRCFPV
jgi:hypothetical protein